MTLRDQFCGRQSRRRALRNLSVLAGAGLALGGGYGIARHVAASVAGAQAPAVPIDHILLVCQ